jgi:hypothetical protein
MGRIAKLSGSAGKILEGPGKEKNLFGVMGGRTLRMADNIDDVDTTVVARLH